MTDGVRAVLVHPLVKGGDIHVAYFLTLASHGMQSNRACSSAKKGLKGVPRVVRDRTSEELRHGRLVFYQMVPLALSHFYDSVTGSEQGHEFV